MESEQARALAGHVGRARQVSQSDAENQDRQQAAAVGIIADRSRRPVQRRGSGCCYKAAPASIGHKRDHTARGRHSYEQRDQNVVREVGCHIPRSRDWSPVIFSRLPTTRTAMISPSEDSTVSVILTGSGVSICCSAGITIVPLVQPRAAPSSRQSLHRRCSRCPAHQSNQCKAQPKTQQHQNQAGGEISQRLAKPEFQSALEKNQHQGQGSENTDGALKIASDRPNEGWDPG